MFEKQDFEIVQMKTENDKYSKLISLLFRNMPFGREQDLQFAF